MLQIVKQPENGGAGYVLVAVCYLSNISLKGVSDYILRHSIRME